MLEAARRAFETDGYEQASLRAIADDAGVAVGTLFNYFPDKLSLLRDALYCDLEAVVADVQSTAGTAQSFEALCTEIARRFYSYYCQRPELSLVLLRGSMFDTGPRAGDFREQVQRVALFMGNELRRLQRDGAVGPHADPEAIVIAFLSHYYFVLMSQLALGDLDAMTATIAKLSRQLVRGVGPQPR